MDRLPAEILSKVLIHLNTTDIFSSMNVSKYWFNVFTPVYYSSIKPATKYQLQLFLGSMTRHSKYVEYRHYIKELDLTHANNPYEYNIIINNQHFVVYILSCCSNLERLTIAYHPEIVKGLVETDMPFMNHLKYLSIESAFLNFEKGKAITDCYYKYGSKLTFHNLVPFTEVLNRWKPDQLSTYLQAFHSLTDLYITVPVSLRLSPVFDILFSACPYLRNVNFCGFGLNGPINDTMTYPQLETLHLEMDFIDVQYIHYIKRKFICLSDLSLIFSDGLESDVEPLIHGIFSIRPIKVFRVKARTQHNILFWQCAKMFLTFPLVNVPNKIAIKRVKGGDNRSTLIYDKAIQTRTIVTEPPSFYDENINHDRKKLEELGAHFDIIELHIYYALFGFDHHGFNQVYSRLSEIYLSNDTELSYNPGIDPSYTVKSLTLDRFKLKHSLFEDITLEYPLLQNLVLLLNQKMINSTKVGCTFQLPETGMKSLTINCPFNLQKNMVVLKYEGDIIVKAWFYNYRDRKTNITKHKEASAILQMPKAGKAFFFKSSTIEDVTFVCQQINPQSVNISLDNLIELVLVLCSHPPILNQQHHLFKDQEPENRLEQGTFYQKTKKVYFYCFTLWKIEAQKQADSYICRLTPIIQLSDMNSQWDSLYRQRMTLNLVLDIDYIQHKDHMDYQYRSVINWNDLRGFSIPEEHNHH
ncbi:hypothetical protein BDB01DRAFT_839383 [Pilobolus umbonatus]|nr:hypothetical protein BDB01DRAFT_839383 [Pilobolus umbonatus]